MRNVHRALWQSAGLLLLAICCCVTSAWSQINFTGPQPGDVYREYTVVMDPNGNSWRVTDPNINLSLYPQAAPFLPNPSLDITVGDLSGATRAEAVISMWGGHIGTKGKAVRFNGNNWIAIPELGGQNGIPAGHSGECYISEPTVVVPVPLAHLQDDAKNQASFLTWGEGRPQEEVARTLRRDFLVSEERADKLSGAWGRHPLLGRMYLPAYRAGTEIVARLRRAYPPSVVLPALYGCRGLVDIVTVQDLLAETASATN